MCSAFTAHPHSWWLALTFSSEQSTKHKRNNVQKIFLLMGDGDGLVYTAVTACETCQHFPKNTIKYSPEWFDAGGSRRGCHCRRPSYPFVCLHFKFLPNIGCASTATATALSVALCALTTRLRCFGASAHFCPALCHQNVCQFIDGSISLDIYAVHFFRVTSKVNAHRKRLVTSRRGINRMRGGRAAENARAQKSSGCLLAIAAAAASATLSLPFPLPKRKGEMCCMTAPYHCHQYDGCLCL